MANEELLTRDELEALLDGVARSRAGAPWPVNDEEVSAYDLLSPENIIAGILPVLEAVQDRFAHQLRAAIFELLRRDVEVSVDAIEVRPYADFITALAMPCHTSIIALPPLAGPGLLVFERALVFTLVDNFFGGAGRSYASARGRDFTATELRLIQRLTQVVFSCLQRAWRPFLDIECSCTGTESNPHFVTAINPTESLAVACVRLELAETAGALHLALPCSMFEQVRVRLRASLIKEHPVRDDRLSGLLREGIKGSRVESRCRLTDVELSLRELMALRPGDFIPVEIPTRATLEVEGVPLYAGTYGVSAGNRALRVDETLALPGQPEQARAEGAEA